MKRLTLFILFLISFSLFTCNINAQERKKVQNRPYIDMRTIHYGILFGFNMMDMELNNIGPQIVEEDGDMLETIVADVDNWQPGFTVGVVGELRLNEYLSFRLSPCMHFGQRHVQFLNYSELDEFGDFVKQQQTLKTTYVALPLDVKFASKRYNNVRPYLTLGITPMMNITGKKQDILEMNNGDCTLNIAMGCDFYLPFFKLIPELRFSYGLSNCINTNHPNELSDLSLRKYARAVNKGHNKLISLVFYFE